MCLAEDAKSPLFIWERKCGGFGQQAQQAQQAFYTWVVDIYSVGSLVGTPS